MAEPWRNPDEQSLAAQSVSSRSARELSRVRAQMEPGKNCAYNHTRGCFVGLHVVAGELSLPSLLDWISTLRGDSGAGIWMIPFRGIPASELRMPVDLLYLDANCRVMEAVELFPTFRVSAGCAPAASVLVLPSYSISSTKTEAGDQLLLCPTEEIKWRLEQLAETGSVGAAAVPLPDRPPMRPILVHDKVHEKPVRPEAVEEQPTAGFKPTPQEAPKFAEYEVVEQVANFGNRVQEVSAPEAATELERVAEPEPEKPSPDKAKREKPWMTPSRMPVLSPLAKLGRWLMPAPRDPRKVNRRPVEGLVAHFFTGGAPQAHEVRDVSASGLYVVTGERWYPGTIIRMTLSKPDTGLAPADRSITVQTRAVRWGNDGVGLEFLVDPANNSALGHQAPLGGVGSRQLEKFLKGVVKIGR